MQAQLDRQAQLHGLGSTAPACWLAWQARLAWQSQADPAGPAGLAACWARLAKPWLARQGPAAQPGPAAQLDPAAQAQLAWPGRPHSPPMCTRLTTPLPIAICNERGGSSASMKSSVARSSISAASARSAPLQADSVWPSMVA